MDYKELIRALRFISKYEKRREYNEINIGKLMEQAATAITDLLARAEAAEAANTQLDGTVSTLMESNKRLVEELKAHSETELAKAHEALSAEWARQKMRADAAEEKYTALLKARFGENASAKMMEMVDEVNEMRQKLAEAEARAEKAERERAEELELLHSYRHICGEKTPEDLERLIDAQDYIDKMVFDMYKLLLSVRNAVQKKDLSIFRNQGKIGVPENRIPFMSSLGKIETEYEELLYASCSDVELRNQKEE